MAPVTLPRVIRALLLSALTLASADALAFFLDVGEIVGGRQVQITGSAMGGSAVLRVVNLENFEVSCDITIRTGPDTHNRRVQLPPLKSRTVNQRIRPGTQRVRVSAVCQ